MNKGNFTAKDNFPVSTFTYDFLQQMAQMAGNLAQLGGQNYILSGCAEHRANVTPGIIVINGEVLPFEGGAKKANITIQETKKTEHFAGVDYPEAYISRVVKFSDTGEFVWSDFVQVLSNKDIQERIESMRGDTPGTVKMWAGKIVKIPSDYKLCNGDILSKEDYPELFDNLGLSFGGDGENSFALPDLRGRFIVGYDNNNTDYDDISKIKTGGKDKITLSIDQMPAHNHAYSDDVNASGKFPSIEPGFPVSIGGINKTESSGSSSGTGTVYSTSNTGGGSAFENRPPYFVLAYIIKVK